MEGAPVDNAAAPLLLVGGRGVRGASLGLHRPHTLAYDAVYGMIALFAGGSRAPSP